MLQNSPMYAYIPATDVARARQFYEQKIGFKAGHERWYRTSESALANAEKMVLWENGFMKTTLELPDGLLQRIKLRAVHRKRKLKDEIAHLLEAGMAQVSAPETPRKPPKPVRLRGRQPVTLREIEAAIAAGRD